MGVSISTRYLFLKSIDLCTLIYRAYVEKYLLEKSRLVYQEHNERWERREAEISDDVGW